MSTIIVRYAEIGLKGKNRGDFENQLVVNICRVLRITKTQIEKQRGQIVIEVKEKLVSQAKERLKKVFGVAWFAEAEVCSSNIEAITSESVDLFQKTLALDPSLEKISAQDEKRTAFAVRASRSCKNVVFTSKDVENAVGDVVRKATKAKVNLSQPNITIFVNVCKNKSYLFVNKIPGSGGLPVGTSGKVLSLLSGGFDSIASSYLMAKRGAQVDFLHFHVFPSAKQIESTKMPDLWKKLSGYTLSKHVYLANYSPFQMAVMDAGKRQEKYELVVFRRLMAQVAEKLAQEHDYQALVLGDSLGQVASQTMENIVAVDKTVHVPIFRPLIGMDKLEVVNLVKSIDLEKQATENYKDCCSIVSTHPATKANLEIVENIEKEIEVEKVAEKMSDKVYRVSI